MQNGQLSLTPSRLYRSHTKLALVTLGALLCLLGFAAGQGQAAGNTFYVSPAGSDAAAGSQGAPFRQIRRALQVVAPGDTVLIADGDYLGFSVFGLRGSAAAPITLRAVGAGARVLSTMDRSDNRDNILLSGCGYLVLDGLRTFAAPRAGCRISQCNWVTVKNGVFGNNGTWGIFTDFSNDLLVENNDCYGSLAEHGIYFSNSGERPTARGNRLYNNARCGIHTNGDLSSGGDGVISGVLYEDNVVWGNGADGGAAINMDGVQDGIVRNNLLFNNVAGGITCYQADGAQGPKGMRILNNTVDMAFNGRWPLLISRSVGLNTVRNNILVSRAWRGGIEYGSWADVANTDSARNVMERVTPDGGASHQSLAVWQGQGYEVGSLSAAPAALWVDPAAGDYHLLPAAPAVDRGAALPDVARDLEGRARPQGPAFDIGCYEAAGPADTTPPAAPTGVTGSAGDAQATVNWNANTESDLAGYFVYRSAAQSGAFSRQNSSAQTARTLTQTGLANGTPYWYRVTAIDTAGNESAPGGPISVTPVAPTFSISGTVTVSGSGAGLAGVTVAAGGATAATGGDGTYALAGLAAGSYTVSATLAGYTFSAPVTTTLGPSRTGVNFIATADATPLGFVKGINLVGGPVTIEGNRWLSHAEAIAAGLSISGAITWSGNYDFPLSPAADADTRSMLQSVLWRQAPPNGQGFALSQALPNGEYEVYLWAVENYVNNYRSANVRLEGAVVATDIGDLRLGEWRKYGPYRATVADDKLDVEILRATKGDPLLCGLAIFGTGAAPPPPPPPPPATYQISGSVSGGGAGLAGATVTAGGFTATTGADGSYAIAGLAEGTYSVTASRTGWTFNGPLSATLGPDRAGVNFTGTANTAPPGFVKGINLGGGAVTIDGNRWLSYEEATATGLSASGAWTWSGTYGFPLSPAADADTRSMLQSLLWRQAPQNGQGFSLAQTLPNGQYEVYVWAIENYVSNYRDLSIRLEGAVAASGIGDLRLGEWRKYGPFPVTVQDGTLDVDVLRTTKGDPSLCGLAIFRN